MKVYSIYKITNLVNGKSYIGYTCNFKRRISEHKYCIHKSSHILQCAFRKYGLDNFQWEIIYQSLNPKHCLEMETYFIKEHKSYKKEFGYNMTFGGDAPVNNEEERKRKSIAGKTSPRILASLAKARAAFRKKHPRGMMVGRKKTEEHNQKLLEAVVGSKWMYHPTTRIRKRVKEGNIQQYLNDGYLLGKI